MRTTRQRRGGLRRISGWAALGLIVALLSSCQSASGLSSGADAAPSGTASGSRTPAPPKSPALISVSPAKGSVDVRPDAQVQASVVGGAFDTVALTDGKGQAVAGSVDAVTGQWRSTGPLASGTKYTLTAKATGEDGAQAVTSSTFSTLKPRDTASAVLIPGDDWEVGVGMPVIVVFSQSVTNRAKAEAALSVSSKPAVEGAWRWFSSKEVHWRPKQYWPAGAKVSVRAELSRAEIAEGVWGKRTITSQFTIGRQQIMTVDVAGHSLTFKRDGKVVRTIPVTNGRSGYSTRGGVKVIMDKKEWEQMDAASLGTDKNDPDYYNLRVQYAMRLTWSGEYLHAAPWSVGSQGRANVSHGCTGMSTANAAWLFQNSRIGDVVIYKNSSRSLEWGNGYTEWNMPFEKYASSDA